MSRHSSIAIGAALFISALLPMAMPVAVFAQTSAAYEAQLRAEQAQAQKDLDAANVKVVAAQGQKATIQQAIDLITAQINQAQAKINLSTLTINGLTKDIGTKTDTVNDLTGKLQRSQDSLANIVRKTDQDDAVSLPEMLLAGGDLSDFLVEVDSYATLKGAFNTMMEQVRQYKSQTEEEKADLEDKKAKETDARKVITAQQAIIKSKKAEQDQLLAIKAGELKTYQQYVAEKQARIAQIQSALFDLRGTNGIPFGDAYDYAVVASKATGVRPALILAILTQESDLGKNVGSCLVQDLTTGNGIGKNSGTAFQRVMSAPRDTTPFKAIADRLGRDWMSQPVSCPPGATYYVGRGFGGGMGPSQFIPSTWELFKKRIGAAVGLSADQADPWNPEHAIIATAIYMSDLGASGGGYTAERNAACKYYSGAACSTTRKPANAFYGDQVMVKAASIQTNMINPILGQ